MVERMTADESFLELQRRESDLQWINRCVSLSEHEGFDIQAVGALLGNGGKHRVYAYGDSNVLKVPIPSILCPLQCAQQKKDDTFLLEETYGEYALATEIISPPYAYEYIMLQRRLTNFTSLKSDHLYDDSLVDNDTGRTIGDQFAQIINMDRTLYRKQKNSIDFIGKGIAGFLTGKPELLNLVIEFTRHGAHLCISDMELEPLWKMWQPEKSLSSFAHSAVLFANNALGKKYMLKNFNVKVR